MRKKKIGLEIICYLYMILYVYTGASKLMDPLVFKEQLLESPITAPVAGVLTYGLPILEILLGSLLVLNIQRGLALWASTALMFVFTVYVIILLIFFEDLPCSCGGIIEKLSWPWHLVLNSVFLLLGILAIRWHKQIKTTVV